MGQEMKVGVRDAGFWGFSTIFGISGDFGDFRGFREFSVVNRNYPFSGRHPSFAVTPQFSAQQQY